MYAVILLALVGAALAVPTDVTRSLTTSRPAVKAGPCETALEWEGRASEWDHIAENNDRYMISFDGKNKRKRFKEEVKSYMPGHRYVEYWQFFNDNVEYQFDHTYGTCKKLKLGPWRNHTIPKDAVLEDTYDVGPPGNAIVANEWSDRVTGRQKEAWIGVFTTAKDGCWPLFEVYSEDEPDKEISWSTRFFNLSAGIKDPKVFDLPAICKTATLTTPLTEISAANEVTPTTEAPGFFAQIKSWLFNRGGSNQIVKRVGMAKTWSANKIMDQMV